MKWTNHLMSLNMKFLYSTFMFNCRACFVCLDIRANKSLITTTLYIIWMSFKNVYKCVTMIWDQVKKKKKKDLFMGPEVALTANSWNFAMKWRNSVLFTCLLNHVTSAVWYMLVCRFRSFSKQCFRSVHH